MHGLSPQRMENERNAAGKERHAEQHAHGHAAPRETQLRVRLAEAFAKRTHDRVERGESPDDETGALERAAPHHQAKNDQQSESFKAGFVKLARMARDRPAAREDHGPGHVGGPPPQLAIDEVRDPAEQEPDRPDRAGDISEREPRHAALAGKSHYRGHAAEKAAMERHAALPDLEYFGRRGDEMGQ